MTPHAAGGHALRGRKEPGRAQQSRARRITGSEASHGAGRRFASVALRTPLPGRQETALGVKLLKR